MLAIIAVLPMPTISAAHSPALPPSEEYVTVNATSALSFTPAQFTVIPGTIVHLNVTQLSYYTHTFTLSNVTNATIPSSDSQAQVYAYFRAHPPLVNLTIPATIGTTVNATFVAPQNGTYEFLCEIHWPNMIGEMVSSATPAPPPAVTTVPAWALEATAGGLAGVVLIAGVAWVLARRKKPGRPRDKASEFL